MIDSKRAQEILEGRQEFGDNRPAQCASRTFERVARQFVQARYPTATDDEVEEMLAETPEAGALFVSMAIQAYLCALVDLGKLPPVVETLNELGERIEPKSP